VQSLTADISTRPALPGRATPSATPSRSRPARGEPVSGRFFLVWALAACAPVKTIESKVSRLKGQSVQGVVQRLGDADTGAPAADGTEWLWTVRVRVPHAPITRPPTN